MGVKGKTQGRIELLGPAAGEGDLQSGLAQALGKPRGAVIRHQRGAHHYGGVILVADQSRHFIALIGEKGVFILLQGPHYEKGVQSGQYASQTEENGQGQSDG